MFDVVVKEDPVSVTDCSQALFLLHHNMNCSFSLIF